MSTKNLLGQETDMAEQ